MSENATMKAVAALVNPIVADLKLDLYDLEFRGGTLRVTIDTPTGTVSESGQGGVNLEMIALATRLISRELDHHDPVPGHYTLEVTSPGLERNLRVPAHFQRELGKSVALRLRDIGIGGERRVQGILIAADQQSATVRLDASLEDRVVPYDHIDRAKTVFLWGPQPKPGKAAGKPGSKVVGKTVARASVASKSTDQGSGVDLDDSADQTAKDQELT